MSDSGSESSRRRPIARAPSRGRLWWVRGWVVWWIACAGLWMVLDDTAALPELVDGAIAAAIGATAAMLTTAKSPDRFAGRRAWLRWWWRPLTNFVTDLRPLARLLGSALAGGSRDPGAMREISFTVEPDRALRTGQDALASVAGSFAPNSIVVAVDQTGGKLIVHELLPGSNRDDVDPLGLG